MKKYVPCFGIESDGPYVSCSKKILSIFLQSLRDMHMIRMWTIITDTRGV